MVVAVGGPLALVQIGVVLLGLVGLAVVLRRRIEQTSASGARSSIRLSAHHSVHVVELDGRTLVIGVGPSGAPGLLDSWPSVPTPGPR